MRWDAVRWHEANQDDARRSEARYGGMNEMRKVIWGGGDAE